MIEDDQIPEGFRCPITLQIMIEPVIALDGNTYEREAINKHLEIYGTSPITGSKLENMLIPNNDKLSAVSGFLHSHPELYEGNDVYLPEFWIAKFVAAIKLNKRQEVQRWLDKDRRLLTLKLEDDSTALHLACEFSSPELVDVLLRNLIHRNQSIQPGAVRFKSVDFNVLLERALNSGDYAKCELLIKFGAEVGQPEASTHDTLLHRMVIKDNQKAVSWLLDQKAALESCNLEGNTPLLLSVIHNNTKLTKFLLKRGANSHIKNAKQQGPILITLLNQNEPILRLLVGANRAALPPLHLALELNDNEIIRALLNQKVGVIEAQDEQQRTPFYRAIESGNREAAALLLTLGANPTVSCGPLQLSTLHMAAERGDVEMLKYLLQTRAVALIDMQNANGDTPLHLAVRAGHDSIIPFLLEAGAYHKIKNEQDQTPIELARTQQKPKTANFIVQTVRGLKQAKQKEVEAKLKEIDRLNQVVAGQASKITQLEDALRRESAQTVEPKNALESQEDVETMFPLLLQFQVAEEEKRRLEERRLEEKRTAENEALTKEALTLVTTFLRLVAEGEQAKAEAMLKSKPSLALASGDVTDLSKRTFNNITGFQYAVWALDWHMWRMIREYLPEEVATEQAQGFETGAWVRMHGVHANLNTLLQAYEASIRSCQAKRRDANSKWVRRVGGAQLLLPAHFVNEYCHPRRSFLPCPNFINDTALPRNRALEWFIASVDGGKLGYKFAYARGSGTSGTCKMSVVWKEIAECDRDAISALTLTRTAQREELITELCSRNIQLKAV